MNKKKEIKNRTMLKLVQGLTGAVFAVSAFMLPVTGFAEEAAATPKYVMPRGGNSEVCDAPGTGVSGSQPGGSSEKTAGSRRIL